MRERNPDILEEQRAAADGALPVAVETVSADARQIHRNEQSRHAMRAGLDRAGSPEHHGRIGLVGGGNRGFFAVDDVGVAVALDAEAQVGRVGPSPRLGERNGEEGLARGQAHKPRLHDVRGAVMGENLAVQRSEQVNVGDAEIGARDLLVDHAGGKRAEAQSAEFLRQLGSDEAHRAHLSHDRAIEDARPIALLETGGDAIGRKLPRLIGERGEIVVEIRVHGSCPRTGRLSPPRKWSGRLSPAGPRKTPLTSRIFGIRACAFP